LLGALDEVSVGGYGQVFGLQHHAVFASDLQVDYQSSGAGAAMIIARNGRNDANIASLAPSSLTFMRTFCASLILMSSNGWMLCTESFGADSSFVGAQHSFDQHRIAFDRERDCIRAGGSTLWVVMGAFLRELP
jgi:hypothetical protein